MVRSELFEGHVTHTQPAALARRFGTTILIDKTLAICSDIDASYLKETGVLKQIIAGDAIAGEYKGGASFHFVPVARMLFSANSLPKSSDKTHGWYSRIRIVDFPHQFETDPVYKQTLEDLMKSPTGRTVLLRWAVEGLQRLSAQGTFTESVSMQAAKQQYREENDSVTSFCSKHLMPSSVRSGGYKTSLMFKVVYVVYQEWCAETGLKAVSKVEFSKRKNLIDGETRNLRWKVGSRWVSALGFVDTQWVESTEFDCNSSYEILEASLR